MANKGLYKENWVKSSGIPEHRKSAQKVLKKLKEERKGKKFILIKHPIKGYIEKEVSEE